MLSSFIIQMISNFYQFLLFVLTYLLKLLSILSWEGACEVLLLEIFHDFVKVRAKLLVVPKLVKTQNEAQQDRFSLTFS